MLLTISTNHAPATDLGYLLTVCLLLEVDPVAMVRRKSGPAGDGGVFTRYVIDRPYVASSFLSEPVDPRL